jgi:dTDP-4-amino-4,6-dideoxygalactose transaminase
MYKIPLFDLNFDKREQEAVVATMNSKWISTGPKCTEFENSFASQLKINHALSLSNCTVGLHLALRVLDIKEGDEVICPSLTFVATANAIRYVKATPVFCDITSMHDLTISPDEIERAISPKTKVIIVMHYAGFPCNMERILDIAERNNIKVIEDACHGPLSEYHGQKLGSIGDIGCFSFFSNKNLSTGEGGMLVTNNEDYYKKAKLLRSHGMTTLSYERAKGHSTAYDVVGLGYNYRMDDIRASIGVVQLTKLKADLDKRIEIRGKYIKLLNEIPNLIVPFAGNNEFVSNYIMPIVLRNSNYKKRDQLREYLHKNGIQTSVHYPAVHKFSIYTQFSKKLPLTEYVTDNEITLPMYSSLEVENIFYIAEILKSYSNWE